GAPLREVGMRSIQVLFEMFMSEMGVVDPRELHWDNDVYITSCESNPDGTGPDDPTPGKLYVPRSAPDLATYQRFVKALGGGEMPTEVPPSDEYWEYSPTHW